MFQVGEFVVCGNKGVCEVEDIATLDIDGVDRDKKYYILKPRYQTASTVYVPVDSSREPLRRVLSAEEAKRLVKSMWTLPLIDIVNEKFIEQVYKEYMRANSCESWAKLIKTIYARKQKRIQMGRKVTAVDAKYFHLAEECLCGELAVALDISREAAGSYLAENVFQESAEEMTL